MLDFNKAPAIYAFMSMFFWKKNMHAYMHNLDGYELLSQLLC